MTPTPAAAAAVPVETADVPSLLTGRIHHTICAAVVSDTRVPEQEVGHKPHGLWYSIDSAWWDWCRSEEWGEVEQKRAFRLDIDTTDILFLTGGFAIDRFTREYGAEKYGVTNYGIDWPKVVARFKGIEIAPYCYTRRLADHTRWYYGWDVASGCLWDHSALRGAELVWEPATLAQARGGRAQ